VTTTQKTTAGQTAALLDLCHQLRCKLALVGSEALGQEDLDRLNEACGDWGLAPRPDADRGPCCQGCGAPLLFTARKLGTGLCHKCGHEAYAKGRREKAQKAEQESAPEPAFEDEKHWRAHWQAEYVKVAKQFLDLEKKFETEADLRVHWQTRCCKVLDELRNQRDMIESYVRELEKARGLLRETFVDPGPTCEHAGNEQNQFAYFHLSVWESLKARCQALLDGKEASDE